LSLGEARTEHRAVTDAGPLPLPRVDTRGRASSVAVAGRRSGTRRFALDVVHLVVLWSLAVAQPLFDVLSQGASFFAARGSSRAEILLFVLGLVLVPALTLAVGELLVWIVLGRRVRLLVHGSLVALLLALIAIQLLQRTALSSTDALVGISAALGVAGAIAYFQFPAARSVVTALSPAPVLFAALFLLHSPVSTLVLPSSDDAASARVAPGPPIVFVVFDEFSVASLMDESLRVDRVRYPNFARLAATSTWFRNDATTNLGTDQAVPALLTGRFVSRDELPVLRDHPDNLFTLLERAYRMNVHETLTRLCPTRSCPRHTSTDDTSGRVESLVSDVSVVYGHIVLPQRLAERLPSISTTWGDFRGAELDGRALTQENAFDDFVDSIGPAARPTLNFLHVEVPHVPWRYLPSGRRYDVPGLAVPGLETNDTWGHQPSLVRQGQQRYLLQVGFVDRLLGRLMSKLRRSGLFDRAIVVVTADHGVSFHAGEGRRTTYRNREDLAFVPLFVKLPNQRSGRVVDRRPPHDRRRSRHRGALAHRRTLRARVARPGSSQR
jgi:sulfatase-like protein